MSVSRSLPQSAIATSIDRVARQFEQFVRNIAASATARRRAQREAEELKHLDPAILADIGLPASVMSPDVYSIGAIHPRVTAMPALTLGLAQRP
jgi:hypothetical protein